MGGGDAGHDVDRHRGIRGVGLGGLEDGSGHPEDAGVTTGDDGDLVTGPREVERLTAAIDLDGVAGRQPGQAFALGTRAT